MSSLICRTKVRGGTASLQRRRRQIDFSKQKFFIAPKPIEGQKTYLHYRNPMRGFRYCKGARGKWIPAYRVTEGMRSNWYRHTGRCTPPGPNMIPPQIPAILKGTLGGGFRSEKETLSARPEIHLGTWEASHRPHHHHTHTFHLDWRTIPGRSIERETILMRYLAGIYHINVANAHRVKDRSTNAKASRTRTCETKASFSNRNFSQTELTFPPMHPSQNSEFWKSVVVTVDLPRSSSRHIESRLSKHPSTGSKSPISVTVKRTSIEPAPSIEIATPLPKLTEKRSRAKKTERVRTRSGSKKLAFRQTLLERPQTEIVSGPAPSPIKLQKLELQKIRVNKDPKVSHIGYYGSTKRKVIQLKVATGAESVPPQ